MAIIIGSLTTVGGLDGVQSVQWAVQVQNNRLWQLGSWSPYRTQVTKVVTLSMTTYAGSYGSVSLSPSTSCADATTHNLSISPGSCTGGVTSPDTTGMFLTSYSYSKGDPIGFGQESWQFQKWVDAGVTGTDLISVGAPTYVIQGISEGQAAGDLTNAQMGISFNSSGQTTGSQGSVSAGFPGIGNADTVTYGTVNSVGGGTLNATGKLGQSSASIPHQPLYLG